jgi:protoporphyrinogen oxidase
LWWAPYTTALRIMGELGFAEDAHPFRFKSALWRKGKLYPVTPMAGPESRVESLREMIGFRGPDALARPLQRVRYSSSCHLMFGLEKRLLPEGRYNVVIPRKAGFLSTGPVESASKSPEHAPPGAGCVHCLTYGQKAREMMDLPDDRLRRLMIQDVQRIIPAFPDEPRITEIARWREAICLQPAGQFPAVHRLKTQHYRDVKGLFLAGAYLYLLSSVEGALRSGLDAAEAVLA